MGWKLVRDYQREYCRTHGISGSWRTSPQPIPALGRKLIEETGEYIEMYDPAELYDLQDALDELLRITDPERQYEADHTLKVHELGRFATHLEWHPQPGIGEEDGR